MAVRCFVIENKDVLNNVVALLTDEQEEVVLPRDYFFIQGKGKGRFIKVMMSDIFFLEGAGNYTKIHLENKLHITHCSLREMEASLVAAHFLRVHRCFVVNMDKVVAVDGNVIQLSNQNKVDLGPNYQKDFFEYIFPVR